MDKLSKEDINNIENELDLLLPIDVQKRYFQSNGFRGPTECQFLYTHDVDENTDIVKINKLIHSEDWFPEVFKNVILVGDDGCGSFIGYDNDTKRAILWHPEDGAEIQETRETVSEIWGFIENLYEKEA